MTQELGNILNKIRNWLKYNADENISQRIIEDDEKEIINVLFASQDGLIIDLPNQITDMNQNLSRRSAILPSEKAKPSRLRIIVCKY